MMIRKSRAAAGLAVAALGALAAAPAMANGADAAAPAKTTTSAGTKGGSVQATPAAAKQVEPEGYDPDAAAVEKYVVDSGILDTLSSGDVLITNDGKGGVVTAIYTKDGGSGALVLKSAAKGPLAALPQRVASLNALVRFIEKKQMRVGIAPIGPVPNGAIVS